MAETTEVERRLRALEALATVQDARLSSLARLAGKAAQDASHGQGGGGDGSPFWRGQVVGVVGASSAASLGSGTIRLVTVIGGVRYWKTDGTAGHHTDFTASNDMGRAIPVNTFVVGAVVNGLNTVLGDDCASTTKSPAADDITAPG